MALTSSGGCDVVLGVVAFGDNGFTRCLSLHTSVRCLIATVVQLDHAPAVFLCRLLL